MKLLLKAAKIIDPGSKYHHKKVDILIEGGIIKKIGSKCNFKWQTKKDHKRYSLQLNLRHRQLQYTPNYNYNSILPKSKDSLAS
jgi:hypothetical protein